MNPSLFNPSFMAMGTSPVAMARFEAMLTGSSLFIHQEGDDDLEGGGGPVSVSPISRAGDAFTLDHLASDLAFRLAELRQNNGVSTLADGEAPQIWEALREWFRTRLQASRGDATAIADEARLALATLDEIVLLKESKNFFSDGIAGFSEFLSRIGHDYDDFGPFLFKQLETYRRERDKAEEKFLVPYRQACKELEGIIADTREHFPFTLFKMKSRIKENTLLKMRVRGWKDMDEFYDLAGIRILVGCHEEVKAVVAVVQGALMATQASLFLRGQSPHFYRPLPPDVKDDKTPYKERGYQATHIDVYQVLVDRITGKESSMPISEVQAMSLAMMVAGAIQYDATYKSVLATDDTKRVNGYYAQAISFVLNRESGHSTVERPVLDMDIINEIRQPEARTCMRRQHRKMEKLQDVYEGFAGYTPEFTEKMLSLDIFKPVHELFAGG